MGYSSRKHRTPVAGAFAIQDIGTSGWTPYPTPATCDFPTNGYKAAAQTGSRIYYINPSLAYSLANDTAALYYLWNGTALIDNLGNLAPTSGVFTGIAYGTDPFNPSASVTEYSRWAHVAPRDNGDIGGATTTNIGSWAMGTTAWRSSKPDMWLFKRGTTLDMYRDMRTFLDDTARTATRVSGYNTLVTAGGVSSTKRAVIGAYGSKVSARPVIKNPFGQGFLGLNNSGPYSYVSYLDLTFDGSQRNVQLSPVDYLGFPSNSSGVNTATNFFGLQTSLFTDILFEGLHFHSMNSNVQLQWGTVNSLFVPGITINRCLINDGWGDSDPYPGQVTATKTGADQTWTGAAFTQVTYGATIAGSNQAGWNTTTSVYSTATAGRYYKTWFHLKFTGTVTGSIQVAMFVGGVQGQTVTIPGTGVALDTYNLHDILYSGLQASAGTAIDIRVAVTAGSGTFTLAGSSAGAAMVSELLSTSGGGNGIYMFGGSAGARYNLTESILIRNGFSIDPNAQSTTFPNGSGRYDWNIYNHNMYLVGNFDPTGCFETGNVSLIGAAGDVRRNVANVSKCFTYGGYTGMNPEHNGNPYTSTVGGWTDNVHQHYRAQFGTVSAHPAWGFLFAEGMYGTSILRNIVTEAGMSGAAADTALVFSSGSQPYPIPSQIVWQNSLTNLQVNNNIFDATYPTTAYAVTEKNGSNDVSSQWMTPTNIDWVTGGTTYITGNTVSVAILGSYTGTPVYQWYRYTGYLTKTPALGAGATTATYTLQAIDISSNKPSVACLVTGIVLAAGAGINGITGTGNSIIQSAGAGTTLPRYFVQDANGGNVGAPVYAMAPTASNSVYSATSFYASRAVQTTAAGGTNANACLATALPALNINVTTAEGVQEYRDAVVGKTNLADAMRRGRWDDRLLGRQIGNHVRTGRGMATV